MILEGIADYLTAKGLTVYVGFLPPTPDTCITLFATGGFPADGKNGYDEPTFQVFTRGATYVAAKEIADTAYSALQGLHHTTLSDGTYVVNCLGLQSAPELLGRDTQKRSEWTQNFRIRVRNKTTHRV